MQISTREFNYHNGTFTAEASTLGEVSFRSMFSRVFDGNPLPDGCSLLDEGFRLVSERTGKERRMVFYKIHRDPENEITHWEWRPFECDAFHNLIVFND